MNAQFKSINNALGMIHGCEHDIGWQDLIWIVLSIVYP